MIHKTAIIDDGVIIPESTNVWAFTHISKGAAIGENCTIGEGVHIGNNVKIGSGCKIQNRCLIYEGVEIGDDVFLGPGVVTTNDPMPELPEKGNWKFRMQKTIIKDRVSICANSTILSGIVIAEDSMIGAGSVVTKDTRPNSINYGSPAKHIRYKDLFKPYEL